MGTQKQCVFGFPVWVQTRSKGLAFAYQINADDYKHRFRCWWPHRHENQYGELPTSQRNQKEKSPSLLIRNEVGIIYLIQADQWTYHENLYK